jgi:enoyl-CoA hydratase
VVACEGHAVAAGAMLLLIADVRIGVPGSYKIGFTEPRLGMPLPALPALLARERLDRRRLHELAVLGRTLNPEDAVGAGFLDKLVAPFDLHAAALTAAKDIAELSDAAYQGSVASVWGTAIQRMGKLVEEQNGRR